MDPFYLNTPLPRDMTVGEVLLLLPIWAIYFSAWFCWCAPLSAWAVFYFAYFALITSIDVFSIPVLAASWSSLYFNREPWNFTTENRPKGVQFIMADFFHAWLILSSPVVIVSIWRAFKSLQRFHQSSVSPLVRRIRGVTDFESSFPDCFLKCYVSTPRMLLNNVEIEEKDAQPCPETVIDTECQITISDIEHRAIFGTRRPHRQTASVKAADKDTDKFFKNALNLVATHRRNKTLKQYRSAMEPTHSTEARYQGSFHYSAAVQVTAEESPDFLETKGEYLEHALTVDDGAMAHESTPFLISTAEHHKFCQEMQLIQYSVPALSLRLPRSIDINVPVLMERSQSIDAISSSTSSSDAPSLELDDASSEADMQQLSTVNNNIIVLEELLDSHYTTRRGSDTNWEMLSVEDQKSPLSMTLLDHYSQQHLETRSTTLENSKSAIGAA